MFYYKQYKNNLLYLNMMNNHVMETRIITKPVRQRYRNISLHLFIFGLKAYIMDLSLVSFVDSFYVIHLISFRNLSDIVISPETLNILVVTIIVD